MNNINLDFALKMMNTKRLSVDINDDREIPEKDQKLR